MSHISNWTELIRKYLCIYGNRCYWLLLLVVQENNLKVKSSTSCKNMVSFFPPLFYLFMVIMTQLFFVI